MRGNAMGEPVAFSICLALRRLTPSVVPIDQLLCLPEPFMSAKGFSCVCVCVSVCVYTHVCIHVWIGFIHT
jgi:hypothetical protein